MPITERTTASVSPTTASDVLRLAVEYNDVLDRCTQNGGENIDELMAMFADDAERIFVGGATQTGKDALRASFLRRAQRLQQVVELKGIELCGDLVVCRVERRDSTLTQPGVEHHLRTVLVKTGKIKRVIVVNDPDEDERLRA